MIEGGEKSVEPMKYLKSKSVGQVVVELALGQSTSWRMLLGFVQSENACLPLPLHSVMCKHYMSALLLASWIAGQKAEMAISH